MHSKRPCRLIQDDEALGFPDRMVRDRNGLYGKTILLSDDIFQGKTHGVGRETIMSNALVCLPLCSRMRLSSMKTTRHSAASKRSTLEERVVILAAGLILEPDDSGA